jgi:hypothetical protein
MGQNYTTKNFTNYYPRYILWNIDPFLGKDRETNNEKTAVARQRSAQNNGSTVGSGVFYVVRSGWTDRVQFS